MEVEAINSLSKNVIGCGIKVHRSLGPGFAERMYSKALGHELEKQGIAFTREKSIRIKYEGLILGEHRLDFLVEDEIIIEVKAMYEINRFHLAQTLAYLKSADKKLGLILNFSRAQSEIKRVAYHL